MPLTSKRVLPFSVIASIDSDCDSLITPVKYCIYLRELLPARLALFHDFIAFIPVALTWQLHVLGSSVRVPAAFFRGAAVFLAAGAFLAAVSLVFCWAGALATTGGSSSEGAAECTKSSSTPGAHSMQRAERKTSQALQKYTLTAGLALHLPSEFGLRHFLAAKKV